ncbi:MAG: hypothetical protein KF745_00260 [Phycisphaeraceae bacterium]|nr:hypothetical protein [Phycisphaeraceae bacterium]
MRTRRAVFTAAALIAACLMPLTVSAEQPSKTAMQSEGGRRKELPVTIDALPRLHVTTSGRVILDEMPGGGGLRGPCPPTVSTHTDANFQGGSYVIQAGFGEQEIAAASYTIPAASFPIKIDLMEFILAGQSLNQQTVTKWGVRVWDGNPNTGTLVAQYDSDDLILPHARIGPGTAGVNIQVSVDPSDPEQIFVTNVSGTNTFSIGLVIVDHHNQTANPCITAPPSNSNAFPVTDTSGLSQASRNWLFGLNCGTFGCPPNGGWATFQALNVLCRPSGDWVMKATWSKVDCQPATGSCCTAGSCQVTTQAACVGGGGVYAGDGTTCVTNPCPTPQGACCFSNNACVVLTQADCTTAAGTYLGNGTACSGNQCPQGACCLGNGGCITTTQPGCVSASGTFQGVGVSCASANCPQPTGACCTSGGGCLTQTQANCSLIPGATWRGAGTACPQACQCRPDWDHNGSLEPSDIAAFIVSWTTSLSQGTLGGDYDGNGTVEPSDIAQFVAAWLTGLQNGCP